MALDEDDLTVWFDPDMSRPLLRLLGPVELRASGERTADVDRRCAYFTEVVAYLATRVHGATPEQVAEAFNVQTNTIHSRIGTVRKWLGTDPATGNSYLPESTLSPAAKTRGVPVYEVLGLLSDADLFKRLRVRGQARGEGASRIWSPPCASRTADRSTSCAPEATAGSPRLLMTSTSLPLSLMSPTSSQPTPSHQGTWRALAGPVKAQSPPHLPRTSPGLDLAAVMVAQGRAGDFDEHLTPRSSIVPKTTPRRLRPQEGAPRSLRRRVGCTQRQGFVGQSSCYLNPRSTGPVRSAARIQHFDRGGRVPVLWGTRFSASFDITNR